MTDVVCTYCKKTHDVWDECDVLDSTEEQEKRRASFTEAATPLIKWMAENCHPHTMTTVDSTNAILYEGQINHRTTEYLKG